jgi:hypothetical protein
MNSTGTEGWEALIVSMTGLTLERVRPARSRSEGSPAAMSMAVWAPRPPGLGPVMRTVGS